MINQFCFSLIDLAVIFVYFFSAADLIHQLAGAGYKYLLKR